MPDVDPDIAALDLEPIAFKACMDEGWEVDQVDIVMADYRIFLHLIRHHPNVALAPSKLVDAFWHHHILDTEKYMEDCQQLFGRYIHHFPYSGLLGGKDTQEQDERFELSQRLANQV